MPSFQAYAYLSEQDLYFFVIILNGVRLSPLGTAATTGLLYLPQMIDGDCGVGGMTIGRGRPKYTEKTCPSAAVHHKSHMTWPGFGPAPPRWEASG
jgi:hypothetical protein